MELENKKAGPARQNLWSRSFILLFLISFITNLGLNMSNSLISVYAAHLGGTATQSGLVFSSFAVTALVFRLLLAPVIDTYNRKTILFIFVVVTVVAFWGYSFSSDITTLAIFRMVQGCGSAGLACTIVMVADILPHDSYGAGIGYFSLAMVISNAIGPATGIWLMDTVGFRPTFAIFAAFVSISLILVSRLKISYKRTKKLSFKLNNLLAKEVFIPSLMLYLCNAGYHFMSSYLVLYGKWLGFSSGISIYYVVTALVALVVRPLLGHLSDRHGLIPVVVPAIGFHVAGCLTLSFATSLWHILLAAVLNAVGSAACQPAFQAISMKKVASERRGAASSMNMMAIDFSALTAPSIGGIIVDSLGYRALFRYQIIPYALIGVVILFGRSWIRRTEADFASAHAGA